MVDLLKRGFEFEFKFSVFVLKFLLKRTCDAFQFAINLIGPNEVSCSTSNLPLAANTKEREGNEIQLYYI